MRKHQPASSRKKTKAPSHRPSPSEVNTTIASFDRALGIIDAAVSGSVIAGTSPYSFCAVLSYWFTRMLRSRVGTKTELPPETGEDLALLFDPVMEAVAEFVDCFTGEVDDGGEKSELENLRALTIQHAKLSELEERRHSKIAVATLDWAIETLSRDDDLPTLLVELTLLVEYLKMAALDGHGEEQDYLVVKQTIPLVFDCYANLFGD